MRAESARKYTYEELKMEYSASSREEPRKRGDKGHLS